MEDLLPGQENGARTVSREIRRTHAHTVAYPADGVFMDDSVSPILGCGQQGGKGTQLGRRQVTPPPEDRKEHG